MRRRGGGQRESAALALALALAPLGAGCRSDGGSQADCDGVMGMTVTRIADHPGGGAEVTARLRFEKGIPIAEDDLVQCLSVEGAPGARIARRPVDAAQTLLLVDPGITRRETDAARALVTAFLDRRPPGEAVAIFRWGDTVTQVAPFHTDRRLLHERVAVGLAPAATVVPPAEALAAAAAALSGTGGPASDSLRTIVLVAPRLAALVGMDEAADRAAPHLLTWIGGSSEEGRLSALPPGLRFPIAPQRVPMQVVSALAARLDAYRRHAHYAVGLCGRGERPIELRFRQGESTTLSLPAVLPENRTGACQAEALAQGQRGFPVRLDLTFTPDERASAAAAFADREGRPPFPLSVRVGADAAPTPATARYRGDASYACQRRSYSIELDGEAPRFFFRGSASRRFELVAMCLDRLYLRTYTVLQMLAAEGLFPVPFDLIEVAVDGVSQGPYLIVEDLTDSLRVHSSRLTSVIRRLEAQGPAAQVRWSATSPDQARASYDRILAAGAGLSGRRLETALAEQFDLQSYLTWVGLMNLVGSGRYSDEIYFYATETTTSEGARGEYHLMMGWDEDELFSSCRGGSQGVVDPLGLVTCAEAALDRRIFSDSLLYVRYAGVLGSVLERHPTERFAEFARASAARVLTFLERPDARAGLAELAALSPAAITDFEVARSLLESELTLLTAEFDHTRTRLSHRLDRFHGDR